MKTNFTRLSLIALIGLVFISESASAAMICRDLFKPSLHSLDSATVARLARETETVMDRIHYLTHLKRVGKQPFSVDLRDLNLLLRKSAELFRSQGARLRVVRFKGYPALEIVPDASAKPGWNRMAASVKSKLNARLLFAPATLAEYGSSAHLNETLDGSRTILISRESLKRGKSEYRLNEEFGHASSNSRDHTDPYAFSGSVESFDVDLRPSIAQGTASHRDQMANDEAVRSAKNFVRVARDLESGDRTARRELVVVAKNARDVVKVTRVSVAEAQAIARSIMIGAEGSGIAMAAEGVPKTNAAFVYSDSSIVYVEHVAPRVVRFKLEGSGLGLEIFVRDPNGSMSGLIRGLQAEESNSIRLFQARLPGVINE
ncbi:MAG: hypothetical protein AAB250_04865, partial [Bdellovibrionota bacterium]